MKNPIDTDMITELEPEAYGCVHSSSSTTYSKMHLSTPQAQKLRTSRSVGVFGSKLAACRTISKELQSCLFSSPNITPSSSDTSSDDEISEDDDDKAAIFNAASDALWLTWEETNHKFEEQPVVIYKPQEGRPRVDDQSLLPLLASVEDVPLLYRSDALRSTQSCDRVVSLATVPSAPVIPSRPKFYSLTPTPSASLSRAKSFISPRPSPCPTARVLQKEIFKSPPPSPNARDPINYSHPQHTSSTVNTAFNTTPPVRAYSDPALQTRSRANTAPSSRQLRPRQSSKLSAYTTNEFPPRTSSRAQDYVPDSRPPSPDFPLSEEDLMGKWQKSGFDSDSDDDDREEKDDLPDWIRRLATGKGYGRGHKDLFLRSTTDVIKKQKKKSKSFSALGEVLKKSLRINRSNDFGA